MRALAVILVVAVLGGGCASRQREQGVAVGRGGPGGEPGGTESTITIVEDATNVGAYIPPNRDVPVGTTVTWSNDTASAHTVDFADPAFQDSGDLAPGQRHRVPFTTAGTFPFSCRLHPQMTGTITVAS